MKFEIEHKGNIYDCEWFDDTDFEKINPIIQASGFIFNNKKEVCVINVKKEQEWTLPGGRVESSDKTIEHTFKREVDEEADLDLRNIQGLGYIKVVPRNNPEKYFYSVRFVALVDKSRKQTKDPAEGIVGKRIFIKPEDFVEYTGWGENGEFQIKKALEILG